MHSFSKNGKKKKNTLLLIARNRKKEITVVFTHVGSRNISGEDLSLFGWTERLLIYLFFAIDT